MTVAGRRTRVVVASSSRGVAAAAALLCATGLYVVAGQAGQTRAAFTDAEHAAGTVTARTLTAPVPDGCDVVDAQLAVVVRWTVPTSQPGFAYEVRDTLNLLTDSGTLAGTATSFKFGRPFAGTYTWRVWTVVPGSSWTSAARTGSSTRVFIAGCSWD